MREEHIEVAFDVRTRKGWTCSVLRGADAKLSIPSFGLGCFLADIYERTPLPRRSFSRSPRGVSVNARQRCYDLVEIDTAIGTDEGLYDLAVAANDQSDGNRQYPSAVAVAGHQVNL